MWLMMLTFFPVLSTLVKKTLKTKPVLSETTCQSDSDFTVRMFVLKKLWPLLMRRVYFSLVNLHYNLT